MNILTLYREHQLPAFYASICHMITNCWELFLNQQGTEIFISCTLSMLSLLGFYFIKIMANGFGTKWSSTCQSVTFITLTKHQSVLGWSPFITFLCIMSNEVRQMWLKVLCCPSLNVSLQMITNCLGHFLNQHLNT